MQSLVPSDAEPITPYVDRARELFDDHGVSTVMVVGGSGDYLDVADTVIRMSDYLPADVTDEARRVAAAFPTGRASEAAHPLTTDARRRPVRGSLDPSRGRRSRYVRAPDDRTLLFGSDTIDLAAVEQLVLRGQLRTVGACLAWLATTSDLGEASLAAWLDAVETAQKAHGPDVFADGRHGDLATVRRFEVAAALNRLRSLRVE